MDSRLTPKLPSKLDKAKELEDYMHSKELTSEEVKELLEIINYSRLGNKE